MIVYVCSMREKEMDRDIGELLSLRVNKDVCVSVNG